MKLEVREIEELNPVWDELARSSRQNNAFVSSVFLNIWVEQDPSWHLLKLGCYDADDRLVGAQAIVHRQLMGRRVQNIPNIFYNATPILAGNLDPLAQHHVLAALSRASRAYFPNLKVEFHPSLVDVRAYIAQGWHAQPDYSHFWDLEHLDIIFKRMGRRQNYIHRANKFLTFGVEQGLNAIHEFLRLYLKTMEKHGWRPSADWEETFARKANILNEKDIIRFYTARDEEGRLVTTSLCLLDHPSRTANFWFIGYDQALASREAKAGLDWYTAQHLSRDFSSIDFGPSLSPNIFASKDSMGTESVPYWTAELTNFDLWTKVYKTARSFRQFLINFTHNQPKSRVVERDHENRSP